MTFIVDHDGVVFQKDVRPNTAAIAREMATFNPDGCWTRAADSQSATPPS
jgi:hypothetical protein